MPNLNASDVKKQQPASAAVVDSIRSILKDRIDEEDKIEHLLSEISPVISAIQSQYDLRLSSVGSQVSALEATIKFVEESNKRIATEHSHLWNVPHYAFHAITVALGLIALVASFKIYTDWNATSAITKEATQQKEKLDAAIQTIEQRGRDVEKQINDSLKSSTQEQKDLSKKVDEMAKTTNDSMRKSESLQQRVMHATSAAHRVLSIVALGRDQLVYHQNPNRAKFYSEKALLELEKEITYCKDTPQLVEILKRLQSSIWTVQAECEFQLLRMDDLEQVAQKITSSDCQCLEGNYYYGLAKLALAVDQVNTEPRKHNIDAAVLSFNKNVSEGGSGHLSFLYLSASQILAGRYQTARDDATEFLKSLPESKEDRVRLSDELRAQIAIAIAWRNVADFLNGNPDSLKNRDSSCSVDRSALPRPDAMLFERVFERLVRERDSLIKDENQANEFALYCAGMIGQLRRSHLAVSPQACGGSDPLPEDILRKYNIQAPVPPAPSGPVTAPEPPAAK